MSQFTVHIRKRREALWAAIGDYANECWSEDTRRAARENVDEAIDNLCNAVQREPNA